MKVIITYNKGVYFQEDKIIHKVCVPNNKTSRCMRQNQIKLQGKIDESKNKVGVFNMPLPEVERMSKQKTRMNVVELNSTFNQTRYNRYILTTSSQRSRIHILFKSI